MYYLNWQRMKEWGWYYHELTDRFGPTICYWHVGPVMFVWWKGRVK